MIDQACYLFALVTSALWFGAAFHYFGFRHHSASKVLIPSHLRSSPLFDTTAASLRFLGGMNGALALLCLVLLAFGSVDSRLFADPAERVILLLVLAAAHFSQFVFNLPVLLNGERQGDAFWYVLSGPMRTIFVIDAVETAICLTAALVLLI